MVRRVTRSLILAASVLGLALRGGPASGAVTSKEVDRAIKLAVHFLKDAQRANGSWLDTDADAQSGMTSLVILALIEAGESATSPSLSNALGYLREFTPEGLNSVYAVSLQTRVFAAVDPEGDRPRIARNVEWLTRAQINLRDRVNWPGTWTYTLTKSRPGDSSNTMYALLALDSANQVGVVTTPAPWSLADVYWRRLQRRDGSSSYTPESNNQTGSMTCEQVAALLLCRTRRQSAPESLTAGGKLVGCGSPVTDARSAPGFAWLASHFTVHENPGNGRQWKFYYLDALERLGYLTGERLIGNRDWFREGAESLVKSQDPLTGSWEGVNFEKDKLVATSFAVLFLARGRAPVLVQKVRHGPKGDWMNDPDDVRNLVSAVSQDWKNRLNWQTVEPDEATAAEMSASPVLFLNGHEPPVFTEKGKAALRDYVARGGFVFAEACCGKKGFDEGFRVLVRQLFPGPEAELKSLPDDHPVWAGKGRALDPKAHSLLGVEVGGRTALIYSPVDLSCGWNLRLRSPNAALTERALRVGQNVLDYGSGRKLPLDKLAASER